MYLHLSRDRPHNPTPPPLILLHDQTTAGPHRPRYQDRFSYQVFIAGRAVGQYREQPECCKNVQRCYGCGEKKGDFDDAPEKGE